ncbi:polysaccharide deacetylase family protein [uncultured Flavobacterium sp.]|uniref:polysaccharide deacetylase family protein n=1 Tax=uncultured Flavobacterium sp. TaxID=165435 RepID=UPI0030EB5749|tara:strand:- start:1721 stop:2350 length:630 start_codon:yes stop_codon:yes gene_type:complete
MVKVPKFIKKIFCNQVWDIPNSENKIYLTFDDGPTPLVTEWVLDVLERENIKATFFCIGNNIEKHPDILKKTIAAGHSIGNHTFNHLKGWKTSTKKYLENVDLCSNIIQQFTIKNLHSSLYRPPYGKIKTKQTKLLRAKGFKVIMWDVLSKDYDQAISPEKCLENTKKTTSGSILVFHDSLKAQKNLEYTLPKAIKFLKEKGFVFDTIN